MTLLRTTLWPVIRTCSLQAGIEASTNFQLHPSSEHSARGLRVTSQKLILFGIYFPTLLMIRETTIVIKAAHPTAMTINSAVWVEITHPTTNQTLQLRYAPLPQVAAVTNLLGLR